MTLPVVFRRAAQAEFDKGAAWYDKQVPGLGRDFVTEVQKVLDTIANQPARYPVALKDVREGPVSRFPWCVYYRVKPDRVVVISVFHTSRNPAVWQRGR